MSKSGILTFHRAVNYGAVLQAYALCKALEKIDMTPEIIDYRSDAIEAEYKLLLWSGGSLKQKLKRFLTSVIQYRPYKRKKTAFDAFLCQQLPLSKSTKDIRLLSDGYAAFITGSDQVFNREITKQDAEVYLLDFDTGGKRKFSYAASLGKDILSESDLYWFRDKLQDFTGISIREKTGVEVLQNVTAILPECSIDPTLLINKTDWLNLCAGKEITEAYILLYVVLDSEEIYSYAKQLGTALNLKIICINGSLKKRIRYKFHYVDSVSPQEFLVYIRDARYVVTSSFHGVALSVMLQKLFMVVLPAGEQLNGRIHSLLDILRLTKRILHQGSSPNDITIPIDWDTVVSKLDEERKASLKYLKNIGEGIR